MALGNRLSAIGSKQFINSYWWLFSVIGFTKIMTDSSRKPIADSREPRANSQYIPQNYVKSHSF